MPLGRQPDSRRGQDAIYPLVSAWRPRVDAKSVSQFGESLTSADVPNRPPSVKS